MIIREQMIIDYLLTEEAVIEIEETIADSTVEYTFENFYITRLDVVLESGARERLNVRDLGVETTFAQLEELLGDKIEECYLPVYI